MLSVQRARHRGGRRRPCGSAGDLGTWRPGAGRWRQQQALLALETPYHAFFGGRCLPLLCVFLAACPPLRTCAHAMVVVVVCVVVVVVVVVVVSMD
jgi:hypothetical protein